MPHVTKLLQKNEKTKSIQFVGHANLWWKERPTLAPWHTSCNLDNRRTPTIWASYPLFHDRHLSPCVICGWFIWVKIGGKIYYIILFDEGQTYPKQIISFESSAWSQICMSNCGQIHLTRNQSANFSPSLFAHPSFCAIITTSKLPIGSLPPKTIQQKSIDG